MSKFYSIGAFADAVRDKLHLKNKETNLYTWDEPMNWDDETKKWFFGEVLTDANDIRTAVAIGEGKLEELPKGETSNPRNCVLARALSNGWRSYVSGSYSKLYHPVDETMPVENIEKAVATLKQMDFQGVRDAMIPAPDVEAEDIQEEYSGVQEYDEVTGDYSGPMFWEIKIDHTVPMMRLVSWFDNGHLPELDLFAREEDQEPNYLS